MFAQVETKLKRQLIFGSVALVKLGTQSQVLSALN